MRAALALLPTLALGGCDLETSAAAPLRAPTAEETMITLDNGAVLFTDRSVHEVAGKLNQPRKDPGFGRGLLVEVGPGVYVVPNKVAALEK